MMILEMMMQPEKIKENIEHNDSKVLISDEVSIDPTMFPVT